MNTLPIFTVKERKPKHEELVFIVREGFYSRRLEPGEIQYLWRHQNNGGTAGYSHLDDTEGLIKDGWELIITLDGLEIWPETVYFKADDFAEIIDSKNEKSN